MKSGALAAGLGLLALVIGCDPRLMPERPAVYGPWEEGLTLGYENPSSPAGMREQDRIQVRVKRSLATAEGRRVVLNISSMAGAMDTTFLQSGGGITMVNVPEDKSRVLPKGFPDHVSRWQDQGQMNWVVGRASVAFPGVQLEPGSGQGVWVESVPVHGPGMRLRTLFLPGIGKAEILVFRNGNWYSIFHLASRGFTDAPKDPEQDRNHGVANE
jgi:hypothetical protein